MLSNLIGHLHARRIKAVEKQTGYALMFPSIAPGWIQGWASMDLTRRWQASGLDVAGVDYFTMGDIVNGVSSRFDAGTDQFQSWIGAYVVRLNGIRRHVLQDDLNLAVVDQVDWLRHYGDPQPHCDLHGANFEQCGEYRISGYRGTLYVGGGYSHCDIGPGNGKPWLNVATSFLAMAFNANNPVLQLTSGHFMPVVAAEPYRMVFLKGYVIVVEVDRDVRAVLYGNGTVFTNAKGMKQDTFESIKDRVLSTLDRAVIIKAQ